MNLNNYASSEASKRLVDAGIVLETDFYWYVYNEDICRSLIAAGKVMPAHYLTTRESVRAGTGLIPTNYIPAPSMAEVWRELPQGTRLQKGEEAYYVWIGGEWDESLQCDINPTDALIDLLIWVRKEASHE